MPAGGGSFGKVYKGYVLKFSYPSVLLYSRHAASTDGLAKS
jgi:hypothetical protein